MTLPKREESSFTGPFKGWLRNGVGLEPTAFSQRGGQADGPDRIARKLADAGFGFYPRPLPDSLFEKTISSLSRVAGPSSMIISLFLLARSILH